MTDTLTQLYGVPHARQLREAVDDGRTLEFPVHSNPLVVDILLTIICRVNAGFYDAFIPVPNLLVEAHISALKDLNYGVEFSDTEALVRW